jgi:hypothetical protein
MDFTTRSEVSETTRAIHPPAPEESQRVTTPSFADLAAQLADPDLAPRAAVPSLDSSMTFAPDDLTDHPARIAEARELAAKKAAAVVRAREAIEAARRKVGEDVDAGWFSVDDDAWDLVEDAPEDVERHRAEALAEVAKEDPDDEDPDARVAINVAHDLALELHALLTGLREAEPTLEGDELRELVDDAETIAGAEQAETRTLARFDVAASLRRRIDDYGRALHEYLAAWPKEDRDDEAERVRELVFGE